MRAANALARDCKLEAQDLRTSATIDIGNAKKLPFDNESTEAIVTSPPYETMYDYFDVHRLSYLAFRWPQPAAQQVGQASGVSRDGVGFEPPKFMTRWYRQDFRGEETSQGRALRAYIVAMRKHVSEAKRVLCSTGVAAYAVANTVRDGRKFSLVQMLAALFEEADFGSVEVRKRQTSHKRILPARRDRLTGRFSSTASEYAVDEYIIYACK